jgi:hypothetical protein
METIATHLDPHHHVQVTLAVLLDYVADVVRFPSLLKFSACHKVLDLPDCPDSIPMCFRQPKEPSEFAISIDQPIVPRNIYSSVKYVPHH